MTDLTIQIDSSTITAELERLQRVAVNMQPAFNAIGQALKTNIENGFRDHKSPDEINWAALSPVTIAKRRNGSSEPLNDTGLLKNSFSPQGNAFSIFNVTNNSVEVGTNAPQAALMNFGGTKAEFPNLWGDIPARPFMPTEQLPVLWQDEILAVIRQHLEL